MRFPIPAAGVTGRALPTTEEASTSAGIVMAGEDRICRGIVGGANLEEISLCGAGDAKARARF